MKRRILCFVLTMAMVLSMLVVVPAATVTAASNTFDASVDEPTISTLADWNSFKDAVAGGNTFEGKTVKLATDLYLGTGWGGIGVCSSAPFSGNFDGQGHMINYLEYKTNIDGVGGVFNFIRVPENSSVYFKNLRVTGTYRFTQNGNGFAGGVITAVDAGTSGNGGTITIENVWSSVNINCTSGAMRVCGGILGYIRAGGTKPITINFESCIWDGALQGKTAQAGGFMGSTHSNISGRTTVVNMNNCVSAGHIICESGSDDAGMFMGYAVGNAGGASGAEVTFNATNCLSVGTMTFDSGVDGGKWFSILGGIQPLGSNNARTYINATNVYYYKFTRPGKELPLCDGSGTPTVTNCAGYATKTDMLALTTSSFTDSAKWNKTDVYYPCPQGIIDTFGEIPASLYDLDISDVSTPAALLQIAQNVHNGFTYAGETITLTADIDLTGHYWPSLGSRNDNDCLRPFQGTFDGGNHTVKLASTTGQQSEGGLIGYAGDGATIKDVKVTGRMDLAYDISVGFFGTVIGCIGSGTVTVSNVLSDVNIYTNAHWFRYSGGFIGGIQNHVSATLSCTDCVYAGKIFSNASVAESGAFFGYTGNISSNYTKTMSFTRCVFSGEFHTNTNYPSYYEDTGAFLGYCQNNSNNTGKLVVNLTDCLMLGKMIFGANAADLTLNQGSVIGWAGVSNSETAYNATNVYYVPFSMPGGGTSPAQKGTNGNSLSGATDKTKGEIAALSAADFAAGANWSFNSGYCPCPSAIVSAFGYHSTFVFVAEEPEETEVEIGTAEALNALATAVNGGNTYEGKTILITSDITIESDWTSIGITSSKPFSGNFNGQGHTIEIHQTLSNPDGVGGLIGFVRTPANGTSTIENVHVTGRIDATNSNTGSGYFGGLIACVDGNTSGSGGTININNVWNSIYINCGNANMWTGVGGMIGFCRHADGLKPLTINFDSCVWDGTLNVGPAAYHFGGFVGYTGNNKAGRTLTINIANSVAAGTIALNQTWDQYAGLLVGYARGGYTTDNATAKVTVNVNDVISNGKMTFKTGAACPGSGSKIGHIGRIDDTTNNEINMTNLYYNAFERGNLEGNAPALDGTANTSTNVEAKTKVEIYNLTTAAFSDASKWNVGTGHNPCPAGIVTTFGAVPSSLNVDPTEFVTEIEIGSVAEFLAFRDSVNSGTTYSGKTVLLTADIDLAGEAWVGIGSRSAEKVFSGTFDGQGHTISNLTVAAATTETGGLFCQAGNATIQNFTLTGTITTSGNVQFMGSVINCVYGNTTLRNVRSLVNFTPTANGSQFFYCGGLVGFIHNTNSTNLTIDGCEYAGNINTGGQTNSVAGILGYTGWGNSGVTKTVTITNTLFTGSINFNDPQYYENNAGFIGYVNRADNGGTITVNISNSYSAGRLYFTRSKAWTAANNYKCAQLIGQVKAGVTLNIDSTVVYKEAYLYTQVENEKPVEDSKAVLGEIGVFGSEYGYDTPAVVASMDVTFGKRDVDDQYKGIRFTATFTNVGACTGGGTASANFGIFLMTRETYEILGGAAVTKSQLVDNNSVVQVKATKFQNNTSSYVVNAVVFNLNTATRQATELVAIAYAGSDLGTAATTTYNAVFND